MTDEANILERPEEIDLSRLIDPSKKEKKSTPTREERRLFLRLLSRGCCRRTTAALARVRLEDVREWMDIGKHENRGEFAEFYLDVLQAEAIAEARLVNAIWKAALRGEWRAAVWLLERIHREEWARRR